MKKLVLLILGFLLGALAMYFYCCKQDPVDLTETAPTPPKGLITPSEAIALDKEYDPRYQLVSDSIVTRDGGDNRSSWFSMEEIESFLLYAENQAGELDYTMNGVRIYLGAYPTVDEVPGYTTMFMMPTGYKNSSQGSMFMMQKGGNGDITGGDGLNKGDSGDPPGANYPQ